MSIATTALTRLFSEADLTRINSLAATNFQNLGRKYQKFVAQVVLVLRENFPSAANYDNGDLAQLAAIADVIGYDSRSMMKRLKTACLGCGWCCSKTKRIVVTEADVDRISRKLKQKREVLFTFKNDEWEILQAHPCQWWNPRNGRCSIYNERPHTCRSWPLGINDNDINAIIPQSECNYAVVALAHKTRMLLQAIDAVPGIQPSEPAAGI